MSEIVAKYGGTSMAHPEQVAEVVSQNPDQSLIVVSAPGRATGYGTKMTDQLYDYLSAQYQDDTKSMQNIRDEVIDRFDELYADLGTNDREFMRESTGRLFGQTTGQRDQEVVSLGETLSAQYFARYIGANYQDSTWVRFNNDGSTNFPETAYALKHLRAKQPGGRPIVTPGFYGYDELGRRHLLGRGGSDRTGALAARILGKQIGERNVIYQNWTDVDGILSGNPDFVENPQVLAEVTRNEVREGAHGGTGVLQGNTVLDLNGSQVVTVVKNTFNPDAPGTRVVAERDATNGKPVVAVTGRDDLMEITVNDLGMADQPGYAAGLLSELGAYGLTVEHMPSSQDTFSITLHDDGTNRDIIHRFAEHARDNLISERGEITVNERGVVYMVGERLKQPKVVRSTLIRVLGTAAVEDIDIYDVVSSSTSPCLALLTDPSSVGRMVRELHAQEIEGKSMMWSSSRR